MIESTPQAIAAMNNARLPENERTEAVHCLGAGEDGERRGDPWVDAGQKEPPGQHHREGDHRADREVDSAGDQQDGHADDDDALDRTNPGQYASNIV